MNKTVLSELAILAAVFAAALASAQTSTDTSARLQLEPAITNFNRIGLSYRMGFNISADFSNLGGYRALNPVTNPRNPQRTAHGDLYNYDNGYIFPGNTEPQPGQTWYYGYSAGTAVRDTEFDLYRDSSPGNVSSRENNGDPQHGLQLTYDRQLGKLGQDGYWGLEVAAGFTDITMRDSRPLRGNVVRNVDTFASGGGSLNPAPFSGAFEGPGPNDPEGWPPASLAPVRSSTDTLVGAAAINGHREFDAQVVDLRFGPYLDLPLNNRFVFTLSGGVLLLYLHSDFSYDETVTLDPTVTLVTLPGERHQGSATDDHFLVGGFVSGVFSYAVSDHWQVFAGAQLQATGDYSQTVAGKQVTLRLGEAVFVNVGVAYSF